MATIQRFEDIFAWKVVRMLVSDVYEVSKRQIFFQDTAMRDQIRRAVLSIPSNIAEGFERGTTKEFINFLYIAKGSVGEVRSQLYNALDQHYISPEEFQVFHEKCVKTSQAIANFIDYLKKCAKPKRTSSAQPSSLDTDIWSKTSTL